MPFIPIKRRRPVIEGYANDGKVEKPGDLSFLVADALDSFVGLDFDFAKLAAAKGAVQSALDQFDELVVLPYEAQKRNQNGDVFRASQRTYGPGWPD